MSDCRLITLAASIAGALNAAQPTQPDPPDDPLPSPFVLPFTATVRIRPVVKLETMGDELLVYLVADPGGGEERQGGLESGLFVGDYTCNLVVQRRVTLDEAGDLACRQLLLLAEQLRDYLKDGGLDAAGATGVLIEVDDSPAYDMDWLLNKRCFLSVQALTFRVI